MLTAQASGVDERTVTDMKKILALLLALSMMAVAVSCGEKKEEEKKEAEVKTEEKAEEKAGNDGTEEKAEENKVDEANQEENKPADEKEEEPKKPEINYNTEEDKAAAKAAVEGFMGAYCAYDTAKMSEFSNTDIAAKLGIGDYGEFISAKIKSYFSEEETNIVYAEEIGQLEEACKAAILGSASYEIIGEEYVGTNWNFKVKTTNITVSDIFSILHGDEAQKLTEKLIDELVAKLEDPTLTEEEVQSVTQDALKVSLTAIVTLVNESCQTTEPKVTEYTITAAKSGDKWIVDYNDKDVQTIAESLLDKSDVK